ncbi:hypothetical protein APA_1415 [Pseudanabaena sp. lw0831]|nr:hypothetical protein APA_1415 [Pseudanabaena sp. lw0831]
MRSPTKFPVSICSSTILISLRILRYISWIKSKDYSQIHQQI